MTPEERYALLAREAGPYQRVTARAWMFAGFVERMGPGRSARLDLRIEDGDAIVWQVVLSPGTWDVRIGGTPFLVGLGKLETAPIVCFASRKADEAPAVVYTFRQGLKMRRGDVMTLAVANAGDAAADCAAWLSGFEVGPREPNL